ncbi:MBL fold metallo-hydrolase [Paenibacillus yonginensis]|uniref:MBL fold metallo-hydrolase n=1 Tax=Paenibacillus yonginensis TaxID=1462996 RepID=A0A1B1N529_9BACL|nr:MBL fold metallo-hydrolase [Paenibacillus yonginensis]ANS76548.1 MBL fold metallo-hydrolase [Paenibacillus yonginensis]
MGLQLQMLGTGSAFAKKNYNNNALLLGDDFTLMIDCGITAPASLYQLGKNFGDIDACLITHIHGDHVGGLEEFGFQCKFIYQKRPVLYIAETLVKPLWENTLKGAMGEEGVDSLDAFFDVRPLKEGQTYELFKGLTVEIFRTPHMPGKNSYSLLLNGDVFYSADMTFQPDLVYKLVNERGVRRIFHECQLTGQGAVHTTLEELKSFPEPIKAMISLMHYGDEFDQFEGKTDGMDFLKQHKIYDI